MPGEPLHTPFMDRLRRRALRRFSASVCIALGLWAYGLPAAGAESLAAAARRILGSGQGVYVETSDGTVLLAQAAQRPVHPASVSKVPTTLALLRQLGPEYRFTTTITANGPLIAGTVQGDLLVEAHGDPFFVDENALLVLARLRAMGVRRVAGELKVTGHLLFNWQEESAAARLRVVLTGTAPATAWANVRSAYPGLADADSAPPGLTFADQVRAAGPDPTPLLVHRSQPLVPLVKALNDYSNNIFKPLADAAGGAAAVQALARAAVPVAVSPEITLGDGAGTDARNRLSPRAAVKLLRALEQELAHSGYALMDILPVSGIDAGTLHDRLNGPAEAGRVVGKTGTFGDYGASALVGALRTRDHGTVYFAILNHGVPIPIARRRQDSMVRELLSRLRCDPWPYQRDVRPAVALAQALPAPVSLSAVRPTS